MKLDEKQKMIQSHAMAVISATGTDCKNNPPYKTGKQGGWKVYPGIFEGRTSYVGFLYEMTSFGIKFDSSFLTWTDRIKMELSRNIGLLTKYEGFTIFENYFTFQWWMNRVPQQAITREKIQLIYDKLVELGLRIETQEYRTALLKIPFAKKPQFEKVIDA